LAIPAHHRRLRFLDTSNANKWFNTAMQLASVETAFAALFLIGASAHTDKCRQAGAYLGWINISSFVVFWLAFFLIKCKTKREFTSTTGWTLAFLSMSWATTGVVGVMFYFLGNCDSPTATWSTTVISLASNFGSTLAGVLDSWDICTIADLCALMDRILSWPWKQDTVQKETGHTPQEPDLAASQNGCMPSDAKV
jgi:hypothetical protein